ncbi:MAG: regulatory protein RecX [Parachlamydiaceae bacterium]
MKLSISAHPWDQNLHCLFKDDEEFAIVHKKIIPQNALKRVEHFNSSEELQEFWEQLEFKSAKFFCLAKLSRKTYTSFELEALLKSLLVSEKTIKALIDELKAGWYLDDDDWIVRLIQKEMRAGSSPLAIRYKLIKKGIPEELLQNHLKKSYTPEAQEELLTRIIKKEMRGNKDRRKLISKLVRKGFNFEDVRKSLEKSIYN